MSEALRLRETREPMDYVAAISVHRTEADLQHAAENFLSEKHKDAANAERLYREQLALEITRQRSKGEASSTARDLARGQPQIAKLAYDRDVAEGMVDAAQQSIYRHTANRRDLLQFIEWSRRAAFLDIETPELR
jgi:hypothetical protein